MIAGELRPTACSPGLWVVTGPVCASAGEASARSRGREQHGMRNWDTSASKGIAVPGSLRLAARGRRGRSPGVTRFLPLRLLDNLRAEAAEFRAAVDSAPSPQLGWDVLGLRSYLHKVWWRLVHEHAEPRRIAIAVFVGVIIGSSPFFGFHLILCILIALALRLNKLTMWLAANVSLPVFAPFLAFASAHVGHLLLHGTLAPLTLAQVRAAPLDVLGWWVVGFPIVGALLGVVLAAIVYRVASSRQRAA